MHPKTYLNFDFGTVKIEQFGLFTPANKHVNALRDANEVKRVCPPDIIYNCGRDLRRWVNRLTFTSAADGTNKRWYLECKSFKLLGLYPL